MIRVSKLQRKGHWYIRFWIGGKAIDESARTESESQAETIRIRREIELNAGIQPLQHADLRGLIEKYLGSLPPDSSESHRHESNRILLGFLQVCGRKRKEGYALQTHQITPELIDLFIRKRKETSLHNGDGTDSNGRRIVRRKRISNVTLRKELRYLSSFLNWCCRQRPAYLRENPLRLSNAPRIKDDSCQHFMVTEDEFRALLKECKTIRQYLFLLLGWWTGARRKEILSLHYYHFDFKKCLLSISHKKNNKLSVIPVSQQIIEIIERLYQDATEADSIFSHDPFPYQAFRRLCKAAGVRHHRFHDFRISTSTILRSGGFDAHLAGQCDLPPWFSPVSMLVQHRS